MYWTKTDLTDLQVLESRIGFARQIFNELKGLAGSVRLALGVHLGTSHVYETVLRIR